MKWKFIKRGWLAALAAGLLFAAALAPAALHAQTVSFAGAQTTVPASGLSFPFGVAVDGAGDVFIADTSNSRVVEVTPLGVKTTVPASGLDSPYGVAVDGAGDVFIADASNNRVVEVTPLGVQTTVPASGLSFPFGVAVDGAGDVFIADSNNNRVVQVTPGGVQTTVPASGLSDPRGVAVDGGGDVLITDSGHTRVVKVTPGGVQTTVPAGGLVFPYDVAIDAAGDVFIADSGNHRVVEVTPLGVQTTLAASGSISPYGVAVDAKGDVFIADAFNNRVVEVQTQSVNFGSANICPAGQTTPAPCSQTMTLNYHVTDSGMLGTPQVLTGGAPNLDFTLASGSTCAGSVTAGSTCTVNVTFTPRLAGARNGTVEILDGSGNVLATSLVYGTGTGPQVAFSPAAQSTIGGGLSYPYAVAVDGAGDVFIADTENNRVVEVTPGGVQTMVATSGLSNPSGVAVDGAGDVYIADSFNFRVVEVTPLGVQTTVPASGLSYPEGVTVDGAGDVYIADTSNYRVVKVTPLGVQTTVPASGLNFPFGVAVDGAGDVFIADGFNNRVVEVTPLGVQTTVPASGLSFPFGVAVDGAGDVFIADSNNDRVVEVTPSGVQTTLPASGLSAPSGVALDGAGDLFIADTLNNRAVKLNRSTPPALAFATTPVGKTSSDSPQSVAVQNIGNASLSLTGLSIAANFGQVDGSGNPEDCTSSLSIAASASCNLSLSFTPTAVGTIQGSAVLSDNAFNANPATQTIAMSGMATQDSQTVIFTGLPATATYAAAGPYTLSASSTSGGTPAYSVTGPATISGSTLTITGAGSVVVTASFAATTDYTAASASQTIDVSAASQTVNFTGLPATANYGSAGPYLLNGTASSGLAVSYNVSGPATITGNTLTITGPGTVIVTASQAGNSNYSAAVPVSLTIVVSAPVSPYDAAISVQYASTQLVYPGATNITVCIAPAHNITATGSVQIFDGTTLLATISVQGGGCAYWYISPGLAAGNHVLTAVYSGDKNNPAGTSAPTTISVAPVPVKLSPACWLTNTGYGANYQCTVSLSSNAGSAQGFMTYSYDGASPVSVPVNNGTANFTLTRPAAGNHSVVIAYAQQTNYAAAGPITENFTVSPAAVNVQLTPSNWYTSASEGISFAATVNSSSAGAPNSNGSVEFLDGNTLLATVPVNSNGQGSYSSTTLTSGSHTITATYSGGFNYASGSSSVSITLTK